MEIWEKIQLETRIVNQMHFNSKADSSHDTMKKKRILQTVHLNGESENEVEINAQNNCRLLGTDGTKYLCIITGREFIA